MSKQKPADLDLLRKHVIYTWQPVAAIAYHANIPVKTALCGLIKLEKAGEVKKSLVRIDGHNQVHLFKKLQYTKIFNVVIPVDNSEDEM